MGSGTCVAPMANRFGGSRAVRGGHGEAGNAVQEAASGVSGPERMGVQTASHARGHWFKSSTAHHVQDARSAPRQVGGRGP